VVPPSAACCRCVTAGSGEADMTWEVSSAEVVYKGRREISKSLVSETVNHGEQSAFTTAANGQRIRGVRKRGDRAGTRDKIEGELERRDPRHGWQGMRTS